MPDTAKQEHCRKWLQDQGQISLTVGIGADDFQKLQSLIGYKPFGLFFALLAQMRAEAQVLLSNAPLGNSERDCQAAVLQGQIRAIDQVRETLLFIADPHADDPTEEAAPDTGAEE